VSFPELFDQLGFPNANSNASPGTSVAAPPSEPSPHQSTPAIVDPVNNFEEVYGGQQPIEIDSTPTTPAGSNHQNNLEIISISSDSDETTRGTRTTHSVEPVDTPYSVPELTGKHSLLIIIIIIFSLSFISHQTKLIDDSITFFYFYFNFLFYFLNRLIEFLLTHPIFNQLI
jgi:hypothetical protein